MYEADGFLEMRKVNIDRLPDMPGAKEKMIFEHESIAQVLRPGEGELPEELDFMKKIEEMKEAKKKQNALMIEKQRTEEIM